MPHPVRDRALYLTLRTFLAAGGRLPLGVSRAAGRLIGRITLRVVGRERQRIERHLEIAFPELDPPGRDRLMIGCAHHFGMMLAEVSWLSRATATKVERLCELHGFQHFVDALESGRGVMFTTAHCGNWELLAARLPIAGTPLTTAVRQLDDPRLDRIVTALRNRFGTEVIPRGASAGRLLARALGRNRVVGLLIDQDIRDVPGVFVPFFGRPAWTPSGAALLAIRLRCPLLPGFIHRRPDGTHAAEIHPPIEVPTEGPLDERIETLTARATAAIERQIRAHPAQWVWMHRRWRTTPVDVA
jgi:KDO2-lipid IV(A) lauroyltransferase